MNNNKGFTLIELIAVLAILGVLGTVITISLSKTIVSTRENECNSFVEKIEEAACVYASLHSDICNKDNCEPIKLSTLINEGLLDIEKDACTNSDVNTNNTIVVSWQDNERICEYKGVREYER